ncbi:MAG: DPP IV N-terminal domain-containing protein [Leadbetterella sp.]|nr:DPP IV N-terminal domain-containing protein [Leadbetterella sp.]
MLRRTVCFVVVAMFSCLVSHAQSGGSQWTEDGNGNYTIEEKGIVRTDFKTKAQETVVPSEWLVADGKSLRVRSFTFSKDFGSVLIFTNTQRVWRYDTRGDYWLLDLKTRQLKQLGKTLPATSLMFAKVSPDGTKAAYVSRNNLYVEDLKSGRIKQLTFGKGKLISGTFDWVYEEEFDCRDGFRWSPDSRSIAFWEIDANTIRDFYMINTTDSIYSFTVPVEYPKVGETPSACRVGVVTVADGKTVWMKVPGDNRQHYIPRMDWAENSDELILQQLNRKQNHSKLFYTNARTGEARAFYEEKDEAWVDIRTSWSGSEGGWRWLNGNRDFLWISEKGGWNHIFRVSRDGKNETLITRGDLDVISPLAVDETNGFVYYLASPFNATQRYLYRSRLDGKGEAERVSPTALEGTHNYMISPNGLFARHSFSNYYTPPMMEAITLPDHKPVNPAESIADKFDPSRKTQSNVEFFKVVTEDGVEMDGWMAKPKNFDPKKKYPVVFLVYSEPASATVTDRFGIGRNGLYEGDMAADGYLYMSVDNRGTPAPKGRAWRKSIYRKIGVINIRDQAMACKKILETYPFADPARVAVHGWSGGGSATLNLLFQYPDLYQTGIAGAAVANQLTYDNIYQERYMGLPQENLQDFVQGSPVTHAKNLKGNLLYIHGTGDDNVHYQNAEMLINELIKYNRQFQFMPYPNRNHGVREKHLSTLFTNYLKQHCPPGARD